MFYVTSHLTKGEKKAWSKFERVSLRVVLRRSEWICCRKGDGTTTQRRVEPAKRMELIEGVLWLNEDRKLNLVYKSRALMTSLILLFEVRTSIINLTVVLSERLKSPLFIIFFKSSLTFIKSNQTIS